ncbi:MAG: pyridoxal phosphate-dependent aminotransferase [Coxiellaceae bacterium]|nr:pyridoxal phosphate-dependent aminotransferase [Coxiellaceae bacterium]
MPMKESRKIRKSHDFGIGSTHIKINHAITACMASTLATIKTPYPVISADLTAAVFSKAGVAKSLHKSLGVTYGAGVRPLITAALQHLANQGKSRFVLPMPNWLAYQPLLKHVGAHCLPIDLIPLANNRKYHFTRYLKQLNDLLLHADVFVFTPYNNPVGIQFNAEETAAIVYLLKIHSHVEIIIDDIYQELCSTALPPFLAQYPELHSRCIYIAGITKSHSLRAGYAIAPKSTAKSMDDYLRLVFGTPLPKDRLVGLKKALTTPVPTKKLTRLFKKRDLLIKLFKDIHGWAVVNKKPDGGNYVLVSVRRAMLLTRCDSADAYAKQLKSEAGIIAIPIDKYHLRFCVRIDSDILSLVKQIKTWQERTVIPAYRRSQLLRNLSFLNASSRRVTRTITLHDTHPRNLLLI